jgi:hypothetical protein
MAASRFLVIHYLDGTSETFTFPKQAKDHYDLMGKLNDAMKADRLTIEADGHLHIIPLSAIKRLQFSPTPESLPGEVIKQASLNP